MKKKIQEGTYESSCGAKGLVRQFYQNLAAFWHFGIYKKN